jgi:hypothetical protein
VKRAQEPGPWLMVPNARTGRTDVFMELEDGREVLVGSLPGNPTDEQIREMQLKLEADPLCR